MRRLLLDSRGLKLRVAVLLMRFFLAADNFSLGGCGCEREGGSEVLPGCFILGGFCVVVFDAFDDCCDGG